MVYYAMHRLVGHFMSQCDTIPCNYSDTCIVFLLMNDKRSTKKHSTKLNKGICNALGSEYIKESAGTQTTHMEHKSLDMSPNPILFGTSNS